MLWTIFTVFLLLWVIGLLSNYTMGGFIHLLLIAAMAILLLRVLRSDRPIL